MTLEELIETYIIEHSLSGIHAEIARHAYRVGYSQAKAEMGFYSIEHPPLFIERKKEAEE